MQHKKIKIGILGCSAIAKRSVIPSILLSENFELVAVASRNPQKAEEYAELFKCKCTSYNELINCNIDAIYVSLPVNMHAEWGKKVLDSGKHLLMEKTFTNNIKQAHEIVEIARKKNLIAMEVLVYVYHSLYKTVISIINEKKIGNIRHISASFGFPHLQTDNIRYQKMLGGGAILDALIYPLSLCLNIAKCLPSNYSYYTFFENNYEVDTRGSVLLNFTDFTAEINYGFGFAYRNYYLIWGTEGHLTVDFGFSRSPSTQGNITLINKTGDNLIHIPPEDQFFNMVNAFADKINKIDTSKINEGNNILERMTIISDIYTHTYSSKGL